MHQTKKGNEWRFGMKLHIGADAQTGVVQRNYDTGERARRDGSAPVTPRRREAGVGRCGLSGS